MSEQVRAALAAIVDGRTLTIDEVAVVAASAGPAEAVEAVP